jgi:hypothetical protein
MGQFRPFLTEPEPVFNYHSKTITTTDETPHCIVHQYDRVPFWKSLMMNKFGQSEITPSNEYFTYRTT